jgi:hypothetical protein
MKEFIIETTSGGFHGRLKYVSMYSSRSIILSFIPSEGDVFSALDLLNSIEDKLNDWGYLLINSEKYYGHKYHSRLGKTLNRVKK